MRKRIASLILCLIIILSGSWGASLVHAKGATYTPMDDVYFSTSDCKVYAEPTYTSTVLTSIAPNLPVRVIGSYSNGWYKINLGVICYCKMDSLTTTGDNTSFLPTDTMAADAKKTADELGYSFHILTLNKEKKIKKDVFNSYVKEKAILYAKIDNEMAVSFKMIYADKVKADIDLNFVKTESIGAGGSRILNIVSPLDMELTGQIAIFQFKVGYDKCVDNYICSYDDGQYYLMDTYYTEFSEFSYAPVTQLGNMMIVESEVAFSLTKSVRERMSNLRKGIKYLKYDDKDYRNSIKSKLRKDTEYIDYQ